MSNMKVLTSRVVDGRIDVAGDLEEGTSVAVLAIDKKPVSLSAAEELELAEALADIRAGNVVDGRELVNELKAQASS